MDDALLAMADRLLADAKRNPRIRAMDLLEECDGVAAVELTLDDGVRFRVERTEPKVEAA